MSDFKQELRKFLEEKPLYSWAIIDLPENSPQFSLSQIEMDCPVCKKSRPFSDKRGRGTGFGINQSIPKLASKIYSFWFTCDGCSSSKYTFFVEVDIEKKRIKKVGQSPAWSINLDKYVESFLEADSDFFKKALICESQGYGIAAFSYYRRILENSIGKILQSLRSVLELNNASSEEIEKIDKASDGIVMDERIKIARDAVPIYLRPNGMNPLSIIYDTLSAGIHRLSEEQCLENAKNIRIALTYLIKALAQQSEEQKDFLCAMKSLNEFNSKSI
jgi:hypothetical protein